MSHKISKGNLHKVVKTQTPKSAGTKTDAEVLIQLVYNSG